MDISTTENGRQPSVLNSRRLLVVSILGVWLSLWLSLLFGLLSGLLSLVGIIYGIWVLMFFLHHRRVMAAAIFALATPVSVSFLWGVIDYGNGNARLREVGLPGTITFYNLDPVVRCGRSTSGCFVSGSEWITQMPYNGAVRFMTACFGWMPNAYRGPYPTEDDARKSIANGTTVSVMDLRQDRIVIDGVAIVLDEGVGSRLLERLRYSDDFFGEKPPVITASVWQSECLVLRIPAWPDFDENTPSAAIVLISRSAGRPFAYYAEGRCYHRYPPVTWDRNSK